MKDTDPRKRDIAHTIDEIVKIADNWIKYLKEKEDAGRMTNALILGLIAGALELVSTFFFINFTGCRPSIYLTLLVFVGCLCLIIVVSMSTYLILRRRKYRFSELLNLLERVKSGGKNQNILEDALELIDKMLRFLPEVKKKRLDEAFAYGVAAFFLASISMNLGIAILVSVIVWLYFRWEMVRTYEKEVAKFEELKNRFEQGGDKFLESL